MVELPPLVIVYFPSQPAPQSAVLTKLAVGPAANAGSATQAAPSVAASAVTRDRTRDLAGFMRPSTPGLGIHGRQRWR